MNSIQKLALVKKRQTPVQSLTKDERIAMAERESWSDFFFKNSISLWIILVELNVYEYVHGKN